MSKFAKTCCILGGIIFAIGLILCIVGFTMGFSLSESANGRRISNFFSGFSSEVSETDVYEEMAEADEFYEFSKDEINKLDIDIKYGTLYIETHSQDYIAVETTRTDSGFECESSGKTLKIEDKRGGSMDVIFDNEYEDSYIRLLVPEDMEFEEVDIEVGAGDANVETLKGKDISIIVGAGTFTGTDIISNKKAEFEVGAGQIDIMGQIIAGDVTIDCGIGSVQLDITGTESDYNYDINCGVGTIRIGESEFSGLSGRKSIDNNADIDIKIDCGIGEVGLDFLE